MNDFLDIERIITLIRRRFLHFCIIGAAAIILSAIFSTPFFIKPLFKSTARIYPVNLATLSMESETEQMLEIINSNDIKFRMFDAFNLYDSYKIDKNDPKHITYIMDKYGKNVSSRKTEFETVEVKVLDYDPMRAARMCDSIIRFYNEKVREMHTLKNWEMVKILQKNLNLRIAERDSLLKLLNDQREKYKILDFTNQIREVTRGYMNSMTNGQGNTAGNREVKQIFNNFSGKGGEAYILENRFRRTNNVIDSLKVLYDTNLSEAQKQITYCLTVEKPFPADKKAYPVRWMIVAFSLASSLFLALLLFLILDYRKTK
jgi:predicted RNA-binding protein with RPS1 domain